MRYNRGTEIKLNQYNNLNVVLGSIDKHNPKTFYLRITGWGNPVDYYENNNYKSILRQLNKKIRVKLFNNLSNNFNKSMTMVDLDMRESGIVDNKSSFMSCEITLYQINHFLLDSDEISKEVNDILEILLKDVFNENKYFKFFKKKKTAKEFLKQA